MDLAKRIRWARKHAEMTQHELAYQLGVAGGSRVSEWENDRRQPSAPILMKLPGILGISGHWLLTGNGPRTLESDTAKPEIEAEGPQDALEADLVARVMRGRMTLQDAAKQLYEARQGAAAPATAASADAPAEKRGLEPPVLPTRIHTRSWLQAPIEHADEPQYAPKQDQKPEERPAAEETEHDESIYEGGYIWGHLAH